MTPISHPQRELVLVGGGHSHVQVLRRLAMEPLPETHVTVVLDVPIAVYSGMVPGFVAGQYRAEELEIDVVPLARRAQARVILSPATGVDPGEKRIHLADRPSIPYDIASFDIGSTVAGLELPGIREHALPTRPIARLVRRVEALVERIQQRPVGEPYRVVVVGGGAGGVELVFALWQRLGAKDDPSLELALVQGADRVLPGAPAGLVRRVLRHAAERGIAVHTGRRVKAADAERVTFEDDSEMPCDALVWVAGAVSQDLFDSSGLACDDRGFALIRPTLQVKGYDDLFAVGDCATLEDFPQTPKAGVYAVRQGPYLSDNLRAHVVGEPLQPYRPQSDFLSLLNLGDGVALGAKWGLSFEGRWVMNLKDRIDRRFMERFQVLDSAGVVSEAFEGDGDMGDDSPMLCGGCAAKVGQSTLSRALSRLPPVPADDSVRLGLEKPDDAAAFVTRSGDLLLSTVDVFRPFSDDPFLVGKISAINALSDLFAKGIAPRHAQALVAIPNHLESDDEEEMLFQVLSGAREVLDGAGVTLLGGHTTTAPELLVGFAVDGEADPDRPVLSLDRLAAGQELILTKPLGTGVLLHADMHGRLRGPWLEHVLEAMLQLNDEAARIAVACGATAMTDVTGFGLVGHLAEMARTSGVAAEIEVADLPAYLGALELMAQGLRSTFHPENAKAKKGIYSPVEAMRHPAFDLLFDPQTSGGLLFGVEPSEVEATLDRLRRAGYDGAARIGRALPLEDRPPVAVTRRG
ncbi:MAG: selenide, water dikinase SelD [Acidobacteriota bacterium]